MENNLNEAFENIVRSVIDGTIRDNGFLYRKEIVNFVEIQIRVEIRDRRMTACMGLLDDWRKDISNNVV